MGRGLGRMIEGRGERCGRDAVEGSGVNVVLVVVSDYMGKGQG